MAHKGNIIINKNIFLGDACLNKLASVVLSLDISYDKVFVLTDDKAKKHVLPLLLNNLDQLKTKNIIVIKAAEHNKTIETCELVWDKLSTLGADRHSLLINLGGGLVTDLGGFVAAAYMRGIKFINIPTTLMAMVDASVGGKTGVDLNGLKNHIGFFAEPQCVFVCPLFLKTLNKRLLLCGFSEMLKHALISDVKYWQQLKNINWKTFSNWSGLIQRSVEIKFQIISKDPFEKHQRKLLNFGHTAAHALEAYCINKKYNLLHGEAVAWGIMVESFLSFKKNLISAEALDEIIDTIGPLYKLKLPRLSEAVLIELMKSDKKNQHNKINFTLITSIGKGMVDNFCETKHIKQAIDYANRQISK